MCSSSGYKQEWSAAVGGIVCARPDAFRTDMFSQAELSSSSLREEIENGERHGGLIDPVPLIHLFVMEKGGGRGVRERKKKEAGSY